MILIDHFKNSLHTSRILSNKQNKFIYLFDFLRIFLIRFFYSFYQIRNLQKPKYKNITFENNNFIDSKIDFSKIIREIDDDGFYDKLKLRPKTIEEIDNQVDQINFLIGSKTNSIENIDKISFNNLDQIVAIVKEKKISHLTLNYKTKNKNNIFKKIAFDDFFVSMAKCYLGTNNINSNISIIISNNIETLESKKKIMLNIFIMIAIIKNFSRYLFI